MQTFFYLLISFSLALGCSRIAKDRGRNPSVWFIATLFFGIFALLAVFIFPSRKKTVIKPLAQSPIKPKLMVIKPEHLNKLWFYLDEAKAQHGPMSFEALSKAWNEQKIRAQTFVWNDAMQNWLRFQEVIKITE